MDPWVERQAQLALKKAQAIREYPALWSKLVSEWLTPGDDRAWLMYAANYLFRAGEVRWALDPFSLPARLPAAPRVNILPDLSPLSFILLTHSHADHLDLELIRALKDNPTRWVVPEYLLETVMAAGLGREKVLVPRSMEPIHLEGITITPFDGLHWEADPSYPAGRRGLPSTGYLLAFKGKRWLFPGDTRTFDASRLPSFGRVDGLVAHLWLGRLSALKEEPPLTDAFIRFCLDLQPRRIIITHLQELGRGAESCWDDPHVQMIRSRFQKLGSGVALDSARMGDDFLL